MSLVLSQEGVLAELAHEANDEHYRVIGALEDALYHMRRCGEALLKAKKELADSVTANSRIGWYVWLRANFRGSRRTADRYIGVALHWDELVWLRDEARLDGQRFSYIRALDALADPKPEAEVDEPEDEDEDEVVDHETQTTDESEDSGDDAGRVVRGSHALRVFSK